MRYLTVTSDIHKKKQDCSPHNDMQYCLAELIHNLKLMIWVIEPGPFRPTGKIYLQTPSCIPLMVKYLIYAVRLFKMLLGLIHFSMNSIKILFVSSKKQKNEEAKQLRIAISYVIGSIISSCSIIGHERKQWNSGRETKGKYSFSGAESHRSDTGNN